MKCEDFEKLKIKPQFRSKIKIKDLPLSALDTETKNGKAFLICDSFGQICYPKSFLDCLRFLTGKRFENRVNLFYNIRYDVLALIKWVNQRNLYFALHIHKRFQYRNFEVVYYDKKFLSIKKGHKVYTFYDLAQFFQCSLAKAAETYLDKKKGELDVEHFEDYSTQEIEKYCLLDCELTYELGMMLKEIMQESGVYYHKWISKGNLAEKYFRRTCYIPTIHKVPEDVLRYSYNSYRGGWIETFRKGFFNQVYEYDIKSAYPAHIRNLISFKWGRWVKRKKIPADASHGFLRAKVEIFKEAQSPISVRYKKKISLNPCGEWSSWITLNEFNYINSEMGSDSWATPIQGWFFIPDRMIKPFQKEIDRLYDLKEGSQTKMERLLYKIILNSLYGKFIEINRRGRWWNSSGLFNPMWASEITANTRLQLGSSIDDKTILVAQDSFITTKRRNFKGNGIGSMSLQNKGECIVLGCGVYEINGTVKNRGFTSKLELRELLNTDKTVIEYIEKKPITLAQALFQNEKFTIDDLNCFIPETRVRDINFDIKRWWKSWNSCREVLTTHRASEPIMLSMLDLFS